MTPFESNREGLFQKGLKIIYFYQLWMNLQRAFLIR